MIADGLSTGGCWQDVLADEVGDFARCVAKTSGGDTPVYGARDADDCTYMIGPFSVGQSRGSNTSTRRVSSRDRRFVLVLVFWSTGALIWHTCSHCWCKVGWLSLTWAIRMAPAAAASSKVFLTVHRIESHESLFEAKLAQQSLNRRDLVGFLVAIEMSQDESRVRRKGGEDMGGLAVLEMVEALTQRLAVDGDVALRILAGLLVEDGCVASEYPFRPKLGSIVGECLGWWCRLGRVATLNRKSPATDRDGRR